MKVIIAGSRGVTNRTLVPIAVANSQFIITEVVSGGCRGVDELGEHWAAENSIKIKRFPADWSKYGRGAGPIRNSQMAHYADALIAIWDRKSVGTKNMIDRAIAIGLDVFVCHVSLRKQIIERINHDK